MTVAPPRSQSVVEITPELFGKNLILLSHPQFGSLQIKVARGAEDDWLIDTTSTSPTDSSSEDRLHVYQGTDGPDSARPTCVFTSLFQVPFGCERQGIGTVLMGVMAGLAKTNGADAVVILSAVSPYMQKLCDSVGMEEQSLADYSGSPDNVLGKVAEKLRVLGWRVQPPAASA